MNGIHSFELNKKLKYSSYEWERTIRNGKKFTLFHLVPFPNCVLSTTVESVHDNLTQSYGFYYSAIEKKNHT